LLLTEWDEYKHLDLLRMRDLMQVPVLVDGRNFFAPEKAREAGFNYTGMGRRSGEAYDEGSALKTQAQPSTPIWTGTEVGGNG